MDEELEEIRSPYVAQLRAAAPQLRAWWSAQRAELGEDALNKLWPTGLAGHPRVLALFREAYLQIEELNLDRELAWDEGDERLADPLDEGSWGSGGSNEGPGLVRHFAALVTDLEVLAPDLTDLVRGLIFVPVGLDEDDEVD